jgi:molybdopterin molybdotransferase
MINVEEATSIINSNLFKPKSVKVGLESAVGHVLAEETFADRDLPPFDRVTMDGIAICFEALKERSSFVIQSTQAAGESKQKLASPLNAIEIMTGAMLPDGADTIIQYEQISIKEQIASISQGVKIEKGQNIHLQGSDVKKNQSILSPALVLSPAEIAILASVGKSQVSVYTHPKIAIVSTGNELVDIEATPFPYQIRKSNGYALQAGLSQMGHGADLFHIPDDKIILEKKLTEITSKYGIIILSGGVSKGKFDFVPEVLESLGIRKQFHQVAQKPGKPFWFGHSANAFVFGLPGNPVSTYLCFYRYIKPWLYRSMGIDRLFEKVTLAVDYSFKAPLTYFLQVKVKNENGQLKAFPSTGGGSGDFANLIEVDGFLELPNDRNEFKKGEVFDLIRFR